MRELFKQLHTALQQGEDAVLVTVVASSGSTPRGAGARMVVTARGRLCGTIGGGAVEFHSQQAALEVLHEKRSQIACYQLRKNEIRDLGMICGGDVHVYFHYIPGGDAGMLALTERIEQLFSSGEESWLISDITEGRGGLAVYGRESGLFGMDVPRELTDRLGLRAFQAEIADDRYYCETLIQAGRVYVFGGGHVSQELVPLLSAVRFRCVVLEDRPEFCRAELFPGAERTCLTDMEKIGEQVSIGEDDYVVVMTRGHKDDLLVQAQVLQTPACYIGVIGSRHKRDAVFTQLRVRGYTDTDLARITTPIGLDIGAETPQEIAVSIAAQMIQIRAEKKKR